MPRHRVHDSSLRFPSFALLWSLALVAVACTGGSGTQAKKVTAQIVEVKDHIVSMDVSSSIDAKGQPVDPSFTFDPTAKQITVLAQVGNLAGDPPLVFTWSQSTSDGDKELFSQTVEVNSLDVAFSVGKSPGTLAVGTYKITATLGGETKSTEAVVSSALLLSSTSGAVSAASSNGDPRSASAGPPVSGQSGAVSQSAPASPAGGTAAMYSEDRLLEIDTQDRVSWSYIVASSKVVSYTADFTLQINGGARIEIRQIEGTTVLIPGATQGQPAAFDQHEWGLDPCLGGSDLPGTTVVVTDQTHSSLGQSSGTASGVFGPDTMAPFLTRSADPPAGTMVKAGDQITFKLAAQELRGPGAPWQTGVQRIGVEDMSGADMVTPKTFGDTALPCEQKSWRQTATLTYTVPENPPAIVKLIPYTLDVANNFSGWVYDYPTTETWTGTMSLAGFTKVDTSSSETVCTQPPVDFTISFTSAPDGTVQGTGRFHGPPYTCVNTLFGSVASAPQRGTFTIIGQRTGDRFSLGITGPFTGTVGALGGFWPNNTHLQWDMSIQGDQAHAVITGISGGTLPGHDTLTVDLTCSGCTIGSS